jgi:hypothetical protein
MVESELPKNSQNITDPVSKRVTRAGRYIQEKFPGERIPDAEAQKQIASHTKLSEMYVKGGNLKNKEGYYDGAIRDFIKAQYHSALVTKA